MYYALGNVFISASRSETQGLTYIEAMAAGLPLLCRDDPCLANVMQDGVNGLTYTDEAAFSEKLHRLMDNAAFCHMLGKAARETVRQSFSSGKFAQCVLSEYRALIQSGHAEKYSAGQIIY